MDLLTGYRLMVEAALAGANVTVLADEFNKALEGGGSLVPVFNLVMGLPLKVACSEAAIAPGNAAAYLSAGFRLFSFDGEGPCCGEGRVAGGFASRRGCAVTC
jgi:hypothetical protein